MTTPSIPSSWPAAAFLILGIVSSGILPAEETAGGGPSPLAGKTIEQLNADDVLKLVRYSYTLHNQDFSGQLRLGVVKRIPFQLSLEPESVQFAFSKPNQVIYLNTRDQDFALYERTGRAEPEKVGPDKYSEQIRGTDLTYDDISMRFLYWPNARMVKEEKYKGREVWLVRVRNPDNRGIYSTVDCWVDKASGGLMKMQGYNRRGRLIRRFEVLGGKKFDDVWMVSEMRIETIGAASERTVSSTRMQITEKLN